MPEDLQELVGRSVTLHGTALDAQAGAIVLLSDGTPVYMTSIVKWDEAMVGGEVVVTGTLLRRPSRLPQDDSTTSVEHGLGETSRSRVSRGDHH